MLKGIILGILIWNVVCVLVALFTRDDFETVGIWGCGILFIVVGFICKIIRKIYASYIKSKYNMYFFCNSQGNSHFSCVMTEKMAENFYVDGENDFYIELYKEGKDWKSLPGKSQYLKTLDKAPCNSGFTYEHFRKFIKTEQ